MCLRAVRKTTYPNKYAYKIVKRVRRVRRDAHGRETISKGFTGPYYSSALYQINKKYVAKGRFRYAVRMIDPKVESIYRYSVGEKRAITLGFTRVRSGSHLYTRKSDAYAFWRHKIRTGDSRWVILKCDIDKIEAYGDDAWGRAVVAMEVTPREVVWDAEREGRLKR